MLILNIITSAEKIVKQGNSEKVEKKLPPRRELFDNLYF